MKTQKILTVSDFLVLLEISPEEADKRRHLVTLGQRDPNYHESLDDREKYKYSSERLQYIDRDKIMDFLQKHPNELLYLYDILKPELSSFQNMQLLSVNSDSNEHSAPIQMLKAEIIKDITFNPYRDSSKLFEQWIMKMMNDSEFEKQHEYLFSHFDDTFTKNHFDYFSIRTAVFPSPFEGPNYLKEHFFNIYLLLKFFPEKLSYDDLSHIFDLFAKNEQTYSVVKSKFLSKKYRQSLILLAEHLSHHPIFIQNSAFIIAVIHKLKKSFTLPEPIRDILNKLYYLLATYHSQSVSYESWVIICNYIGHDNKIMNLIYENLTFEELSHLLVDVNDRNKQIVAMKLVEKSTSVYHLPFPFRLTTLISFDNTLASYESHKDLYVKAISMLRMNSKSTRHEQLILRLFHAIKSSRIDQLLENFGDKFADHFWVDNKLSIQELFKFVDRVCKTPIEKLKIYIFIINFKDTFIQIAQSDYEFLEQMTIETRQLVIKQDEKNDDGLAISTHCVLQHLKFYYFHHLIESDCEFADCYRATLFLINGIPVVYHHKIHDSISEIKLYDVEEDYRIILFNNVISETIPFSFEVLCKIVFDDLQQYNLHNFMLQKLLKKDFKDFISYVHCQTSDLALALTFRKFSKEARLTYDYLRIRFKTERSLRRALAYLKNKNITESWIQIWNRAKQVHEIMN